MRQQWAPSKFANGKPRVSSMPYLYDVAAQNIPEHYVFRVFGRNGDVDNLTEDCWTVGGSYVFPAAPQQMKVASMSVDDTALGAGVRSIDLHYLDSNYHEKREVITLNGTTFVNTVATDILRVNRMHTETIGTVGTTANGDINLTNMAATQTYCQIPSGINVSEGAFYTVPARMADGVDVTHAFLTGWHASAGASTGAKFVEAFLRATVTYEGAYAEGIFLIQDLMAIQDKTVSITFETPIRLPSKTDIRISLIGDASNSNAVCMGRFNGWIE